MPFFTPEEQIYKVIFTLNVTAAKINRGIKNGPIKIKK